MVSSQVARQLPRLRLSPTRVGIGALTLLAAGLYSAFALFRFYQFDSSTYDLVIFDQAVRSYAHFQPGISIVKGLHNGFGPSFSVLGDHFSPIIAALAPIYWFNNGPQNLLIAQSILFALAIPPVWLFTCRAVGGGRRGAAAAYLVSAAYALSWPIAAAVEFDFHETAFAPVLTAVALERLQAGRTRTAMLALAALLLVKEDAGLLVAGVGVVLVVSRQCLSRQRLLGTGLIVAGLAVTVLAIYVLIPAMGGRSDYYFAYGAFGSNVPQALLHMAEHPGRALLELITPRTKLDTMIWLVGAFAFLPLLSPITLATVPLLLERMLASKSPNWWSVHYHYNAFIVVILVLGAVDGGIRLGRWAGWLRTYWEGGRSAATSVPRIPAQAAAAASTAADGRLAPAGGPAGISVPAQAVANVDIAIRRGSSARIGTAIGRGGGSATIGIAGGQLAAGAAPRMTLPDGADVRCGRPRTRVAAADRSGPAPAALTLAAMLLFAMALMFVPRSDFGAAFQPGFFDLRTPVINAQNAAVAAVPSGVTVAAANKLGPRLAGRDTVVLWDGDGRTPALFAPWVIASTSQVQFTFSSISQEQTGTDGVAFLEHRGYQVVFDRLGYYVLHRGD